MNKKIIKSSEIPEGELVYLRKGSLGWKVVYPTRNEDNTINWKHLITGNSWWNLVFVIIFVTIALGCIYEYYINMQAGIKAINKLNEMNQYLYNYTTNDTYIENMRLIPNITLNINGGVDDE